LAALAKGAQATGGGLAKAAQAATSTLAKDAQAIAGKAATPTGQAAQTTATGQTAQTTATGQTAQTTATGGGAQQAELGPIDVINAIKDPKIAQQLQTMKQKVPGSSLDSMIDPKGSQDEQKQIQSLDKALQDLKKNAGIQ
jgi:hypothetical protein